MKQYPIFVSKPFLPPLKEYSLELSSIWKSGILTHHGPLVQKLEGELEEHLEVSNFSLVTNGTIALQLAIRGLELSGEIITTPFTYIATADSILWERCEPVFVDINKDTFNIDSNKIKSKISSKTCAILAVHVFSSPCDIDAIQKIANIYNLKVIYDAAHAFGVKFKGRSVLSYGDVSTVSFHATKLFNTGEGGACVTKTSNLAKKIKRLRFFGHDNKKQVVDIGCNAKMTEIHAALGLVNLKYIDKVINDRQKKYQLYQQLLGKTEQIRFQRFSSNSYNYSYMPIVFSTKKALFDVLKRLNQHQIFPRRYFYPSINTYKKLFPYQAMPVSESVAQQILCLPLYYSLSTKDVRRISLIINRTIK